MMASRRTPEYKALRSNFHNICDSLSRQPATITPLANELASTKIKIISEATRNAVASTKGLSPYDLASQLISAAHVTIEYTPDKLYLLAEKLKAHGHEMVARQLLDECQSNGGRPLVEQESTPPTQEFDLSHPALQTAPKLLDLTNFIAANLKNKWREIGIQLGIKTSTLDAIYDRRNRNASQCFTDVFEEWERSNEVPYTWAGLLEAIASPYVDEKPLAIEIRQKVIDKMKT